MRWESPHSREDRLSRFPQLKQQNLVHARQRMAGQSSAIRCGLEHQLQTELELPVGRYHGQLLPGRGEAEGIAACDRAAAAAWIRGTVAELAKFTWLKTL